MTGSGAGDPVRRVIGVSLNAAVDKTVSVERLVPGAIHRPALRSIVPGGKAVNVVRAARHLGLPGSAVAFLGGNAGRWYRDAMAAAGIGLDAVEVSDETRTCLSILDESTGALTELYEAGVQLRDGDWPRLEDALHAAIGPDCRDTVVVLAGSLPPGAPVDAYARLARIADEAGARAVVDVAGPALAAALEGRPWLIKVNAEEAGALAGTDAHTRDGAIVAAQAIRDRGAGIAIVTRGIHGAVLVASGETWSLGEVPADHRGPFSVGSGDAFLAGFLVGLARDLPPGEALRLAGAAGAANARVPGQGDLDPDDVERTIAAFEVTSAGGG